MEADVTQQFREYWNDHKVAHRDSKSDDDFDTPLNSLDDEGVEDAEWLILAGLPHLSDAFMEGRFIDDDQLRPVCDILSVHQMNAVHRRVNSLNQTIKHRNKSKYRKPDIRDVFKNVQNDAVTECDSKTSVVSVVKESGPQSLPLHALNTDLYNNVNNPISNRERVRHAIKYDGVVSKHDMFRKRPEGDVVASENADGIRMLAFQKLETLRNIPYDKIADLAKADKLEEKMQPDKMDGSLNYSSFGFEYSWQLPTAYENENSSDNAVDSEEILLGRTWIDTLHKEDVTKLKSLLFVELSAIFDRANVQFPKIKKRKKKKNRDGHVFGICLETLLERDAMLVGDNSCQIPLIFTKILNEIERRGMDEQGLLRVAGHKVKVDCLCQEIEKTFYHQVQEVDQLLQRCAIHDLTAVLKKLLRDLPESILTTELINLFYQLRCVPEVERALNLLILLLPPVNRLTLLAVVSFMCTLVEHEENNKMNSHNVAMIIAPSLFPRRYIHKANKYNDDLKTEIELAAVSCRITELLMKFKDRLNIVPSYLIDQLRQMNNLQKNKSKNEVKKSNNNKHQSQLTIIYVDAPQFEIKSHPVTLSSDMTAGDVVLRIIDVSSRYPAREKVKQLRRKDFKQRGLTELAPNGNLSCLLSTADPETAINTHFVYECGGNIGQRRIEPSALITAVHQKNPDASWTIQCDHRNALKRNSLLNLM